MLPLNLKPYVLGVQNALPRTAVGYLYVSEHHFVGRPGLKNAMRASIRANRLCAPPWVRTVL